MNIFTSFFVLLLLLSKNIPSATENIPYIGALYCLNMAMIATSTIACTFVVHIYYRGQDEIPWILRKIFLQCLARIFCMNADTTSDESTAEPNQADAMKTDTLLSKYRKYRSCSVNYSARKLAQDFDFSLNLIQNDAKEIRDYLSHTQKKVASLDSKLKQTKDWKQIALILDRLLFFMYIIIIAVACFVMLL